MSKITYMPRNTGNNGWTVIERTGNRKTGYTEKSAASTGLTMHAACAIAATMQRDYNQSKQSQI